MTPPVRQCANGMTGEPECRPLIRAMIDMGWTIEQRADWFEKYRAAPQERTGGGA